MATKIDEPLIATARLQTQPRVASHSPPHTIARISNAQWPRYPIPGYPLLPDQGSSRVTGILVGRLDICCTSSHRCLREFSRNSHYSPPVTPTCYLPCYLRNHDRSTSADRGREFRPSIPATGRWRTWTWLPRRRKEHTDPPETAHPA